MAKRSKTSRRLQVAMPATDSSSTSTGNDSTSSTATTTGFMPAASSPARRRHDSKEHDNAGSSATKGETTTSEPSTAMLLLRLSAYGVIMAASIGGIYALTHALPPLDSGVTVNLQVSSLHDIKALAMVLQQYSEEHFAHVLGLFTAFYVFKQTFSIPGAMALNLVAGSLYGTWGSALAIFLTAVGASCCYLLSRAFGAPLVKRFLIDRSPDGKVARLAARVRREHAQNHLLYYLLFLRIFPLTPNWLLNLASPVIGVPLVPHFFVSVLVGLAPYNIVTTQAGAILASLDRIEDILQPALLAKLAAMAAMALVPVWLKRRSSGYLAEEEEDAVEKAVTVEKKTGTEAVAVAGVESEVVRTKSAAPTFDPSYDGPARRTRSAKRRMQACK
ncbi:Transmembrane protein 41A [Allomyces arbusculus]|nr:Transmembrane protein 41A [Allomyces arbusculus]